MAVSSELDKIENAVLVLREKEFEGVRVGKYRLCETMEGIAIWCDDGEGGVFDEAKFAAAIDRFYGDNF